MSRIVFDIEADELLINCTRMWILVAYNLDTKELKYWLEDDLGWQTYLNTADTLIGHNITGFDLPALFKLFNWKPNEDISIHDTLLLSQILNYKRFASNNHSLSDWGEFLSFPKSPSPDFSQYSEEMKDYCIIDVKLNVKVYNILIEETIKAIEKSPNLLHYLQAEHYASRWISMAEMYGWPFDVDSGRHLIKILEDEMQKAYDKLVPRLGLKVVAIDKKKGKVETKFPKWTKQGFYDVHTSKWFGIDPCSGYEGEERQIQGEYCRIEIKELSLDSVSDVKIFLFRNGWEPTEYNYVKDENGKKIQSTPKITEDSLEFLGGDGKLYTDFLTAKSRHSILKTWLENIDSNNNLHGKCMLIGTPSMRARHQLIVNVPSVENPWGKELRTLFKCKPGWKLIGCDSKGNQARGLAHYLNNKEFIDTLLHGDIHQYNADVLTKVVADISPEWLEKLPKKRVERSSAKRILYAFLFGASGKKLWSYIFGSLDAKNGNKLKNGFLKAVPGFKDLITRLENIYGKTSQYGPGYIPNIVGNRIYVDSFHKLLVYLLQATEKATCSTALMLTMKGLEEAKIPYIPCIYYHDEIDFQVPEEFAEKAAAIGEKAFAEGPRLLGIEIMEGNAKIGNTWYDVH